VAEVRRRSGAWASKSLAPRWLRCEGALAPEPRSRV